MAAIKIFYVPCANEFKAQQLAEICLHLKLAACSNIFPIKSMYYFDHALNSDTETALILKTLPEKEIQLEAYIKTSHNYQIPCILRYDAVVNDEYYEWMKEQLAMSNEQ